MPYTSALWLACLSLITVATASQSASAAQSASEPIAEPTVDAIKDATLAAAALAGVGSLHASEGEGKNQKINYRCPGVFISKGHIMVAAHCIADSLDSPEKFVFYTQDELSTQSSKRPTAATDSPTSFKIKQIFIHPNYSRDYCAPANNDAENQACNQFQEICGDANSQAQQQKCFAEQEAKSPGSINYIAKRKVFDLAILTVLEEGSDGKAVNIEDTVVQGDSAAQAGGEEGANSATVLVGYSLKGNSLQKWVAPSAWAAGDESQPLLTTPPAASSGIEDACSAALGSPVFVRQVAGDKQGEPVLAGIVSRTSAPGVRCTEQLVVERLDDNWDFVEAVFKRTVPKKGSCNASGFEVLGLAGYAALLRAARKKRYG